MSAEPMKTTASLVAEISEHLAEGFGVEDVAVRLRIEPREMPDLVRMAAAIRPELRPHIKVADRLDHQARLLRRPR